MARRQFFWPVVNTCLNTRGIGVWRGLSSLGWLVQALKSGSSTNLIWSAGLTGACYPSTLPCSLHRTQSWLTGLPSQPHQKPSAPLSGWFPDNSVTWDCFGWKACARRKSGSRVEQRHPSLDQLRLAQRPNLGNSRELRVGNLPSFGQSIAGLRLDLILPHYPDCKGKMSGNTESHPHNASSQYWSQFAEFPVWQGSYCIARNWIFELRVT